MTTATAEPKHSTAERSGRRPPNRADLLGGLAAALGAVLVTAWALQIWDASARVPFTLGGDANGALNAIKNLLRHDWYYTTNLLGAPFGQKLYDFPAAGDLWNLLTVKTIGVFTGDPALVMNVFFLMTFPLTSLGAYIAMRVLGVQIALAAALGILYSVLPYHFQRGEPHLFLSAYFVVPLACAVLIRQMDTRTMARLPRRGIPLRDTILSRGTVGALVVALLVAGTGLYYAFFFVALAAVVGVLGGIRARSVWPVLSAGLLAGVVIAVIALTNVPSLLYQADHGANAQVANNRATIDVDNYGLKIANLVLPVTGHRIDALAELKAEALGGPVPSEGTEALGLIGAAGFVGLLVTAFWRLSTGRHREPDPDTPGEVVGRLAALTITCVVFGVIGGGATVVSVAGFSEFHAWNRISVFVAFFSFAAVGIWLTTLLRRYVAVRRLPLAAAAVAVALVVVGAYDQTTPAFTPSYAATSAGYGNDRAFVAEAEHVFGRSASIFQLPYVPFPEYPPVFGMVDYDHLRGYLHSDSLHWSYGGVKGRESDWQPTLLAQPTDVAVTGVAAAGFDGLYVDRAGYADRGAQLERELRGLLGAPIFESPDARLVMYDLRPLRRRLTTTLGPVSVRQARDAILRPPRVEFGPGFYGEERDATTSWHWGRRRAELFVENTTRHPQRVVVSFGLGSLDPGASVTVTGLGAPGVLPTSADAARLDREITLAPGVTRVRFESAATRRPPAGSETRDLRFRLVDARVPPSGIVDVAHAVPAAAAA
ncbi:MAG: hypothetical protein MUP97_16820 [Acidimicrobiia bacterium]|nr:hypothetical protein [Acidimicrobiia bacterium]